MFESPDQQWRDLTAHYAEMFDGELLQLAADYKDLMEMAQMVLRDEMKKRGLGDPARPETIRFKDEGRTETRRAETPAAPAAASQVSAEEWLRLTRHYAELGDEDLLELAEDFGNLTAAAQQALSEELKRRNLDSGGVSTNAAGVDELEALKLAEREMAKSQIRVRAEAESDGPRDYSWKVPLCECSDSTQAQQIRLVLGRNGIESWVSSQTGYSLNPLQIVVAADQLEEAQGVIAQPIPQDIIDESKVEVPEFTMPKCPKCGTEDPVLEPIETGNHWVCERCGYEWDEVVGDAAGDEAG